MTRSPPIATLEHVRSAILDVPDFPIEGVTFKDITPVLQHPPLFRCVVDRFVERWAGQKLDQIVGIESRGFILGAAVASQLSVGLTLARKPGKLPRETVAEEYELEYGTDRLELHADSFQAGSRIAIIDDVLATGGTAAACSRLVRKAQGQLVEVGFLMELGFLGGAAKLEDVPYHALLTY